MISLGLLTSTDLAFETLKTQLSSSSAMKLEVQTAIHSTTINHKPFGILSKELDFASAPPQQHQAE